MQKVKLINYIIIVLLGVLSFALYANSLHGEFLIDDYNGILVNPNVHHLKSYLESSFSLKPSALWDLSRAVIWHVGGGNPFYFHLFNILANCACVMLLFVLLNVLFKNTIISFLASLIFAIHPIHTEAISWISGGHYVFSSIFFIAALIFYVKSASSLRYLALAVVFFTICFFSGNAGAMLPLVFIIYDLFFRSNMVAKEKRMRIAVLSLMIIAAALFIGIFFVGRNTYMHAIFHFRGPSYLVVITKAFVYYLKILYLPLQRGLYHPFGYTAVDTAKLSPLFFGGVAILIGLVYLFFGERKRAPVVSFGIAWFFITYLPYSNIVPVCNIISERYMYLPSAGFALILAWMFLKAWEVINKHALHKKILRCVAVAAITLYLGSYAALTLKRNTEYNDLFTFWETNIRNFPQGYMAYNNLAGTYYTMGEREQALAYSWVNLMINPNQAHVWCNLGKIYREKGDIDMAEHCYKEALLVDKTFMPACVGLEDIDKLKKAKESGGLKANNKK